MLKYLRPAFLILLVAVFRGSLLAADSQGLLSGTITSRATGELLPHGSISAAPGGGGTTSDSLGHYSLPLPFGKYSISYSFMGFAPVTRKVTLSESRPRVTLDIALSPRVISVREVSVVTDQDDAPPTVQKMESVDIRRMPTIYSDALRSIQILPGISGNNELSSAYNVRGGNYDENLIYLNGYEIYRPFLLRQGVEENQSLINPDMIDRLQFFGGAFPANYGDKMSSVLSVDYTRDQPDGWGAVARADLLNQGLTLRNRTGRLSWSAGGRFADPNLFVSQLQTSGTYRPRFADGQLLADYSLARNTHLELFLLDAGNRFQLNPQSWTGNFLGLNYMDVRAVKIAYQGQRLYSYQTALAGLRFTQLFKPGNRFSVAVSRYSTEERENTDLLADVYYSDNAWSNEQGTYLKTRTESNHDRLKLTTWEIQPSYQMTQSVHTLQTGLSLRWVDMTGHTDEYLAEAGDSMVQTSPIITRGDQSLSLNSVGGYVRDVAAFSPFLHMDMGVRVLNYAYTRETLVSPRAGLHVFPDTRNTISLSTGLYDQPPFFYELRNRRADLPALKSQRAIHYVLEWEHQFERDLTLQTQTYYKKLDRLIPYNLDQMKLEYGDSNNSKGYAYGFDVLLRGQVSGSVNSWISYGFLNTQEKVVGAPGGYHRRLLDQTHTLRLFLQDKMPHHPNIQVHNRMLFGTGYSFHPQNVVTTPDGGTALAVDYATTKRLPIFFRADVGFSARVKLGGKSEAIILAEVLNAFNRANVAGYSFFPVFPTSQDPVKIPEVLSDRFFNLGVELHWN
jgi:hypothetical protein